MLKSLREGLGATLPHLGAVRVHGADAVKFLQGQLSNDTTQLTATHSQLAGLHNAQGRVIALLRLVLMAPDDVLAVLPRELAAPVATRLSKYVLRAKAKVTDASADWRIAGTEVAAARGPHPPEVNLQSTAGGLVQVLVAPHHRLLIGAASADPRPEDRANIDEWRRLEIAAGLPQVYAATSEAFVAQMLNLDVLGAISFEKGCYTGQEIIARAHYRGRVKRRMQRFRTRRPSTLDAGDSIKLSDGRSAKVVDAVAMGDGRYEFLAVTNLDGGSDESSASAESAEALAQTAIEVESLPLPYDLPD